MRKWWKNALNRKPRPKPRYNVRHVLGFESLEDRRLLTTALTPVQPVFVQEGPAPIVNQAATTSNGLVKSTVGSVQAIGVDSPADSSGNTVFVGAVNGGVWKTTNYGSTGAGPTWTPITDQDNIVTTNGGTATASSGLNGSLSISALAVDKSTTLPGGLAAGSALVAATGHYSDVGLNGTGPAGGPLTGVWEDLSANTSTLNPTWYQVVGIPTGKNYAAVAVGSDSSSGTLTQYIFAADNGTANYFTPLTLVTNTVGGLYEVTATFTNGVPTYTAFQSTTPLPAGAVTDVIQDPSVPTTFYAALIGSNAGVYRTTDDGKDWVQIADIGTLPELSGALNVQLAPAKSFTMYVGIVGADDQLDNVYFSTNDNSNLPTTQAIDGGVKWTGLGAPTTADGGINFYQLGALNFSIAADPNNNAQFYVGGDFAPPSSTTGTWPDALGSAEDTGIVFRGNVAGTTATWTPLVGSYAQNTSPPGGTRELVVAPNGELMEANNGGIYDRTSPTGAGAWVSHNGLVPTTPTLPTNALATTEFYSVAYNPLANTIIGGTQDLGIVEQGAQNGDQWNTVSVNSPGESVYPTTSLTTVSPFGISGGQIAIDTNTPGQAILYSSDDYFNNFFEQRLSSQMTTPPVATVPTMLVNGSNGQTIYQVENDLGTGPTFSFQTPIATNNVQLGSNYLVVGSDYVYESINNGATWTPIQGLSTSNGQSVPINGVGPVTAMAYGGTYQGIQNQYVLWVGSSGGYGLYLRTMQTFTTGNGGTAQNPVNILTPQQSYGGGTPVGIVMNPTNWTHTYVAASNGVTLASVPITGGVVGTTKFTSLGGPAGVVISGVVYVPLPTAVNPNDDAVVVSGWATGNSNSTGVYEILVDKTTGLVANGATWAMVGAPADGVQSGITGQEAQLPHVPVTAITYNAAADVLVVTTEGRGAWTLPSFANSNTGYTMSVTGGGTQANVSLVAIANQPGYFEVLMNGALDTLTINGKPATWPIQISLVQQSNIATTATNNNLDLNFVNGNPMPTGRFIDASTGTANTLSVEDDATTISLNGNTGGGTLSMSNSPTTVTLQTPVTGASLSGGAGDNNFVLSNWAAAATLNSTPLNGGGGTDSVTYTSNNNSGVTSVLTNASLTQAVGATALNTITFANNSIAIANLTGGTGANTFDLTNWLPDPSTGGGSISGGTGPAPQNNTLIDNATVDGDYIMFSDTGIIIQSLSGVIYKPLMALANLQTINLSSAGSNAFDDQGWSGTANIIGGTGLANSVLDYSTKNNTAFTLTDSSISTGTSAVVNMQNIQYVAVFGGPGANTYNVSAFDLTAYVTGGGTSNTIVAAEKQNYTISNTQLLVGSNGGAGTFILSGIQGLNLNTVAGNHTVMVNSWQGTGSLSAGTGADTYIMGGQGSNSTLNGIGHFNVYGGGGSTLTLNDENGSGVSTYWYDLFNNSVVTDTQTPRNWGGVNYDGYVYNVTLEGAAAANGAKFLVGPSTTNSFVIYGNSPNDFLGVLFYGTQQQNLTITVGGPASDTTVKHQGYWTFNAAAPWTQMPISFAGINSFNGVTPLVVSGGASASNASEPLVRVYDASTGDFVAQWDAYPTTFKGGVQIAVGQFLLSQPNTYYIVTAPGPGMPDLVKVWTETGQLVTQFYPFAPSYTGGLNVAVGDVTGDGVPDIVVAAQSQNTMVTVINGASLNTSTPSVSTVRTFPAYAPNFTGGASIAVAYMNGDKYADIVTVLAGGGQAKVHVLDGYSIVSGAAVLAVDSYIALPPSYTLGATVAVGDVNADGVPDIVVAAGVNGSSQIVVTNGASAMTGSANPSNIASFYAYPTPGASTPNYTATAEAPVRIALKDILGDGRMEIFTSQGTGGVNNGGINILWQFSGSSAQLLAHLAIPGSNLQGGLTVG
jgi:hypothetical protein